MASKKKISTALNMCLRVLNKLTESELQEVAERVAAMRLPDTGDFDETDWENVARMQADGVDHDEAIRQQRVFRDEAITDGEIEP